MSYGALFNTHTLLFENRYKGAILYVGGVFPTYPPLVDGINHMPRIDTPFLMLNGEQTISYPSLQLCTSINQLELQKRIKK